jgi:hypothetical protein
MSVSNVDIYRAATMLIEQHGAEALGEAAKMIDAMLDHGDPEGREVWRRIREAIVQLQELPTGRAH